MRTLIILSLFFNYLVSFSQTSEGISQTIQLEIIENGSFDVSKPTYFETSKSAFEAVSKLYSFTASSVNKNFADIAVTEKSDSEVVLNAEPKYYMLIIGINDYEEKRLISSLENPIKDAKKLQEVLVTRFTFNQANSQLLLNPTRHQMLNAFEELSKKITERDNLLIFYAGHGFWDTNLNIGYWLPSNANYDNKANWISNSTVRDYISGIKAKHTLLIADACFSGSIFKARSAELNKVGVANLYKYPSRKAMTSGTLTAVPDESTFMRFLLKRLSNVEHEFTSSRQLFYSIETAVINNSMTIPQFGVIQNTGDEGGDFIFIKKK